MRVALQEHTKNIQTMGGRNQANPWFFLWLKGCGFVSAALFLWGGYGSEKILARCASWFPYFSANHLL